MEGCPGRLEVGSRDTSAKPERWHFSGAQSSGSALSGTSFTGLGVTVAGGGLAHQVGLKRTGHWLIHPCPQGLSGESVHAGVCWQSITAPLQTPGSLASEGRNGCWWAVGAWEGAGFTEALQHLRALQSCFPLAPFKHTLWKCTRPHPRTPIGNHHLPGVRSPRRRATLGNSSGRDRRRCRKPLAFLFPRYLGPACGSNTQKPSHLLRLPSSSHLACTLWDTLASTPA